MKGDTGVVKSEAAVVNLDSLDDPFGAGARAQLASLLPEFIARRRWFRAKTRTIQNAEIEDVFRVVDARSFLLVIRVEYSEGKSDEYVLAVALGVVRFGDGAAGEGPPEGADVIATYRGGDGSEGDVYDALSDRGFRNALLEAIACNHKFYGGRGDLVASRTNAFSGASDASDPKPDSFVSGAEQSNTSIIYGDRFILKLFRKIEAGVNPDIEIGTFLTDRGFRHTPAVLGKIEYAKNDGNVYAAAILQKFVRNRGDAWKYTLESLSEFFDRALATGERPPTLPSYHPMQLAREGVAPRFGELLGEYVESADLLGRRTAEMHAALADPQGGSDFAPDAFTAADGLKLYEEMTGQADIAFELLRRKQAVLRDTAADDARMVLRMEDRVTERFLPLRDQPITSERIRFHGDYHLGQVLYTGTDFMIIDFEGEPARPLSERRSKTLAMRDVAGMVRSFQYAAYAAAFGKFAGIPTISGITQTIESWATFWTACISAAYLTGYFRAVEGLAFVSSNVEERRVVFDSFLLQKALYEVAYELNNRPDWVRIPLRGILNLIS